MATAGNRVTINPQTWIRKDRAKRTKHWPRQRCTEASGPGAKSNKAAGEPAQRPGGANGTFPTSGPRDKPPDRGRRKRRVWGAERQSPFPGRRRRTKELYLYLPSQEPVVLPCHPRKDAAGPVPKEPAAGAAPAGLRSPGPAVPGQPRTPPLGDGAALIPYPWQKRRPAPGAARFVAGHLVRDPRRGARRRPAPSRPTAKGRGGRGLPAAGEKRQPRPRHSPHMVAPHGPSR